MSCLVFGLVCRVCLSGISLVLVFCGFFLVVGFVF